MEKTKVQKLMERATELEQMLAEQEAKGQHVTDETNDLLERIQKVLEEGLPDMDWRDRASLGYDLLYAVSRWAHKDDEISHNDAEPAGGTRLYGLD